MCLYRFLSGSHQLSSFSLSFLVTSVLSLPPSLSYPSLPLLSAFGYCSSRCAARKHDWLRERHKFRFSTERRFRRVADATQLPARASRAQISYLLTAHKVSFPFDIPTAINSDVITVQPIIIKKITLRQSFKTSRIQLSVVVVAKIQYKIRKYDF